MKTKQIRELRRLAALPQSEFQKTLPVFQNGKKDWKKTLALERVWFACFVIGSWGLSNALALWVLPEGLVKQGGILPFGIHLFFIMYATRLTVLSVRQMGEE